MTVRTYSEMIRLPTFEERFHYLALRGVVGESTFGFDRWMNQEFYRSREWKRLRNEVIARDNGCDLAVEGYEIFSGLYVHHMNPMTAEDLIHGNQGILDPEFLILTTHQTHNAIHYGDEKRLPPRLVERKPGDTKLW